MAKQLHQESLTLHKEIGGQYGIADSLHSLAIDAIGFEEYEEAEQLFQESLVICREIGHPLMMAYVLGDLGTLANVLGEYAEAI